MRFLIPRGRRLADRRAGPAVLRPGGRRGAVRRDRRRASAPAPNRRLVRLPHNINDPAFCDALVASFDEIAGEHHRGGPARVAVSHGPHRAQGHPRQAARHDRAAASRSSAAAPAPASRPSARRPAASTSSSSTTPAATAWPGAARSPGCWPTATPTRSCVEMAREVLPVVKQHAGAGRRERHRSVPDRRRLPAAAGRARLLRRAELPDGGPDRRR